jgi:serine/threonine protein kinase
MGEVWRARDARLNRDVAIKLSSQQFTDRFDREARAIAALNHSNICTLFDVGPNYLVMELIEGPTLADRIAEGPIPLEEALAIARQIADALEAAHEKNIVHRDLKPANIKLRPDGSVKVLDFGLAKAGGEDQQSAALDSPTIMHLPTQAGVILGTAAYMAPEQARGKAVDKRADIWSFGVVLYEMVTGKRPFEGDDLTETLASVVKSDPDLTVPPPELHCLLSKCLQKDPKKRLRDIGDAWEFLTPPAETQVPPPASGSHGPLPWIAATVLAAALGALAFFHFREPLPALSPIQFVLDPPEGQTFSNPYAATAISPDGRYLIFAAGASASPSLWLRPLASHDIRQLPGTTLANSPFWSPDSSSIAFFADNKLKRLDLGSGGAQILCDSDPAVATWGGAWGPDGSILFSGTDGLHRAAASGGQSSQFTHVDVSHRESAHTQPQFLPGGTSLLYFVNSSDAGVRGVYAATLDNPDRKTRIVATDHKAFYIPPRSGLTGMLLWVRNQSLMAQPFDPASLKLSGEPQPVADSVYYPASSTDGRAAFWPSASGALVWRSGDAGRNHFVWMDRSGKILSEIAPVDLYGPISLSHDGKRVALSRSDDSRNEDIWTIDLERHIRTRITFDPLAAESTPVWSPDGHQIAYTSNRGGIPQIYRRDSAGSQSEEQLTHDGEAKVALDWSPDGRYILYRTTSPHTSYDLYALPVEPDASGSRKPIPVAVTPFGEVSGKFSPNGKWVAYSSNESGYNQVYVRPFPSGEGRWQISVDGGDRPWWRADGREIFFDTLNVYTLSVAAIRETASGIEAEPPKSLFNLPVASGSSISYPRPWVATPDGQRFLVVERSTVSQSVPLIVMKDWQALLKK